MMICDQDESARLAALRSLEILDTPSQECFDHITDLCVQLFDCSVAVVSLVDDDRQWFLARSGVDAEETSREFSFCHHALNGGRYLLVSDALEDERFSSILLAGEGLQLRSYLGQPLAILDGHLTGTLCVADCRPDVFSEEQVRLLRFLAKTVEDLFAAHAERLGSVRLAADLEERTEKLAEANRIFRQTEKTAGIGSWDLEIETGKMRRSEETLAILEYRGDELLTLEETLKLYAPGDQSRISEALEQIIRTKGSGSYEADIVAFNGQHKRIRLAGKYVPGTDGDSTRVVGIVQDVSEAYQANLALRRAADHDSLTGLLNRHAFDRILGEMVSLQRSGERDFFVLLLDLDGFKDINDTFGHLVGDAVLEEIGSRVSSASPANAAVARWGGDEFAIISPFGSSEEDARELAGELIEIVAQEVEIAGRKTRVTATCGLAQCDDRVTGRELMRRVDLALYYGKTRERGRVHKYVPKLEGGNRLRQDAITRVRNALAEDRLFAGYQPIVHLDTTSVVGFEALMRLVTRAGDRLTATEVLPAILDPVLSRNISDRMTALACDEFAEIQKAQPATEYVSLNATVSDLLSRNYAGDLLATLGSRGLSPRKITLEITETMPFVNDAAAVQAVLYDLRAAGMKIALDDFGTGFSSLSHLRDFPIDKVKIDGSFVQKMCQDHQTRIIVQALIGMAKNLGIEVIGEGIETEEQRRLLLSMGCNYGQGFLFSPAETACRLKLLNFEGQITNACHKNAA